MKKVSLKDIANHLGVSTTLVSMVLNNQGDEKGISAKTQKRVKEYAQQINYKPNQVARSLRMGSSKIIGLIIADISNVFYSAIAKSIEDKASENGYNIMFMNSEETPEHEAEMIRLLIDRGVDGLILSTSFKDRQEIRQLRDNGIPFVLIDRYIPGVKTNYVLADNYQGAFDMTEHLISQGMSKIAVLNVTPSHLTTMKQRIAGYKDALRKHGYPVNNKLIKEVHHDDLNLQMEKVLKELIIKEKVQSIFFLNNKLTITGLEVFKKYNIRIPLDVSIASFDDIELFRFSYPTITAVIQPKEEIGRLAFEVLLNQIRNSDAEKQQIVLPVKVVTRESCGSVSNKTLNGFS